MLLLFFLIVVEARIRWMSSDLLNNATSTLTLVDYLPFVLYTCGKDVSHHVMAMSYHSDDITVPSAIAMMYFHGSDVTGFTFSSDEYQEWILPHPDKGVAPYKVKGDLNTQIPHRGVVNVNVVFSPINGDYYIAVPGDPTRYYHLYIEHSLVDHKHNMFMMNVQSRKYS